MVFLQYGLYMRTLFVTKFLSFFRKKMATAKNDFLPENLSIRWYSLQNDVKIIEFRQIFLTVDFSNFELFLLNQMNYCLIFHIFDFLWLKNIPPHNPSLKG
jgi:hypothetical protein